MKLNGTAAVVTGAASGLGAATAKALAAAGVSVVGLDLARSVEAATGTPDGVRLVASDVTSEEDVAAALAAIPAGIPLRVVVNCAGIATPKRILSSAGTHDLELYRRVIEINLIGTFNVLRLAAAVMAETEPIEDGARGVIVNTASVAGFEGQIGQAAYASSKGGVIALTITAARDLARNGIRVNTIAPGIVNTPLMAGLGEEVNARLAESIPFPKRLAEPDEFAELVLMIAQHDYLNGETIRMDGALRMGPQ